MSLFARITTFIGNLRLRGECSLYTLPGNSADSAVGYLYLSEYEIGVDPESEGKRDGWVKYDRGFNEREYVRHLRHFQTDVL